MLPASPIAGGLAGLNGSRSLDYLGLRGTLY